MVAIEKTKVIERIIYPAMDELSEGLDDPSALAMSPQTLLYGEGAGVDSLTLVGLIFLIEENIAEETGAAITLVNDKAMSLESSPFQSVSVLAEYIQHQIEENE